MHTFQNLLTTARSINPALNFVSYLSQTKEDNWTRKQIFESSQKLAHALRMEGIKTGDILAICAPSQASWIIYTLATWQIGATLLPIDPKLSAKELLFILDHAKPEFIAIEEHLLSLIKAKTNLKTYQLTGERTYQADLHPSDLLQNHISKDTQFTTWYDDQIALISYTSGTTNSPKGVMLSAGALAYQANQLTKSFPSNTGDKILSICGLNHMLEFSGTFLCSLINGNQILFSQQIHPKKIIHTLSQAKISRMIVVPHLLNLMKSVFQKTSQNTNIITELKSHFNAFICGGAALSPSVQNFYNEMELPVFTGYGLTETAPVVTVNTPQNYKENTVGKALPGTQIYIKNKNQLGEGEIYIKGPQLMKGFLNNPQRTKEDIDTNGWFHTGDIGKIDKDGFLSITGRIKNMIALTGGKKIHTEEVEEVLSKSKKIKEICVLPLSQKNHSEKVTAVIIPQHHNLNESEIQTILQKELSEIGKDLATYKRPSSLFIYPEEEFPKTSTLKIKRTIIQEWIDKKHVS